MRPLVILAAFWAPASAADPLGLVDYATVIDENSDRAVPLAEGRQVVFLDDGIELTLGPDGQVEQARDVTGQTALGCVTRLVADISGIARNCPGALTPGQADYLDTGTAHVLDAYARATAASSDEIATRFEALIQQRAADPSLCIIVGDYAAQLYDLVTERGADRLARVSKPDRLPVEEPCVLPIQALP